MTYSHKNVNEKILIIILFFIQFTHMVDFVIMMPLGPKLIRFFQMDSQQFSLVVSAYAFSAAVSSFFSSFFIDRYDRKTILTFFYSGFLFANIFCALSPNYPMLILARVLAGVFGGVLAGIVFSILGDVIPEQRRGAATGVVMSAFGTASVVGIPLGLFLAEHFNWHSPFWLISILSFLVILLIHFKLPHLKDHLRLESPKAISSLQHFKELFEEENYRKALICSFVYVLSSFVVIPFVSQYNVKNVGLQESDLAYIYFAGGLSTLVTSRFIGKLSDKYGKHLMFYIIAPLSTIAILITTQLPPMSLSHLLFFSTLFFILISGRFVPLMSIITSSVKKKHRGSFMSLNSSLQQIGMGLAGLISGLIIKTGEGGKLVHFNHVGYISAALTFFCIYLVTRVKIYSGPN